MIISYQIMLAGSLLLLISIIATSLSNRIGMPVLLIFLAIGMLAGEQGPGHIQFQNMQHAHLIGTVSLAIILLDAGLHTPPYTIKTGTFPAVSLALIGTFITCLLVGIFAAWLLNLSWLEGLLIGAIIAPTDAAAVFSVLRNNDIKLKPRIAATLEIESGSNDPLAVLLTVSLVEILVLKQNALQPLLIGVLLIKIGVGAICGLALSIVVIRYGNRLKLLADSLYPLFILASGMVIFAATELLKGSGYLAIYLAGILIGNSQIKYREDILRLHDSFSWLSQICMFLMLGLLVTPSALLPNIRQGFWIAIMLMFIARPVATWISLLPFRFNWREKIFISWIGLRGAVPLILAINPMLGGLKNGDLYFNIIFFVVIISIIIQGWTILPLAKWLNTKQ